MTINLQRPDITELKPRITVFGVGGGGGNAVNNMINAGLQGVDFVVANTDAQALTMSKAERVIQLGANVTEGLGAGALPEVGCAAAEECIDEIIDHLANSHMAFITAGMGGGTGTGAAPVIARAAREKGILTVGVVTKPFQFEGARRMKTAEAGIEELQRCVDTLIVIPNQNLFRIANDKTTFADAFAMADQVLYSGVASITDLMVKEGMINLDFADVRSVMHEMGRAMMGTGEASGEGRALAAAEAAIANPLLDETSMHGARGLLISITGGRDMKLFEVDEAANRIREEVDADANVIFGAIDDESLEGILRVSVVATGINRASPELEQETDMSAQANSAVSMRKFEGSAAQQRSRFEKPITSTPIAEVMEALEVEMDQPAQDSFRPQSHIFKAPQAAPIRSAAPAASPQAPRMAQRAPMPQQTTVQAVRSEATARVLEEVEEIPVKQERQLPQQPARAARMPELSDFPAPTRDQMNARATQRTAPQQPQGQRSLWQKLTQSLIHRDDEQPSARLEPAAPYNRSSSPQQTRRPVDARHTSSDASVYAPHRSVEPQARPQARMASEEDQLEIPAFLRRQANS